jgi:exodeoxyribonuclease VII small subunit
VGKLEEGNVPLDESLKLFEEGIKLSRFCGNKLEEIERKIEVLTNETDADDQPVMKPFEAGEE